MNRLQLSKSLLRHARRLSLPMGRRAAPLCQLLSTCPHSRQVRMQQSHMDKNLTRYPTPGHGLNYEMKIFDGRYSTKDINDLQDCIWTDSSFLPRQPAAAQALPTPLSDLSDIARRMAVELREGDKGLLATNDLRKTVAETLHEHHWDATRLLLQEFQQTDKELDPVRKQELAQDISNVAFWSQWLIKGVLMEGKLHGEQFCAPVIRAPLSKIAFAANAALGRHQIEFVYDDYTLKAATFPESLDLEGLDYEDPKALVQAVAQIETPVGFLSIRGGTPEHNFRHVHSLMEYQMIQAFQGSEKVLVEGDPNGWKDLVEAARQANRVFHTMLQGTPPSSYPWIRLFIKGVRGACGFVYHPHGVFYEGLGTEQYVYNDPQQGTTKVLNGIYIDDEWGQTGANSSMYKYFDMFCGVAQARHAYAVNPMLLAKMNRVLDGTLDSGSLGDNPIDSMQRAFDLFTRPPKHMNILVDTHDRLHQSGVLDFKDPNVLMDRLRLACWVADHRMTHGRYVMSSIYQTKPVGGQSRAAGTGGSTPPFLKLFLDQTLQPARSFIIELLMQRGQLTQSELDEISWITHRLDEFEMGMERVRSKGQELEFEEERIAS